MGAIDRSSHQAWAERFVDTAFAFKLSQVVEPAYVVITEKDLWDSAAPTSANHFIPHRCGLYVDFGIANAFGIKQLLGSTAVRAGTGGVHSDFKHGGYSVNSFGD
ncbi:hypothetical protein BK660_17685 [Pseudomonas brassicacearum]|uniref:Uncharacterized protein n=1 Tax=Pseudomonas brassicacearum TaxID=930166 RepID=A0A423I631_9PSED|nr:hypothetical protein BK660_17685 [Pseudomonas brassicacearum]